MPTRTNRLTFKEKRFTKKYVKNKGNGVQTVLEVYDAKNYKTAKAMANDLINKPKIQNAIEEELNRVGLTKDYLDEKLKETIDNNLKNGKPMQSVGADLLKFTYQLYNRLPNNTKKSINVNLGDDRSQQSISENTQALKELNLNTMKLLEELKS